MSGREKIGRETGVALALAIIVVVVAGIMGSALLLVVRNSLEATVAANNARRAFYAADAGARLARRELLADPRPESYNDAPGPGSCKPPTSDTSADDSDWSYAGEGVARDIGDGRFTARVLALGSGCDVPTPEPGERRFRVFSEGDFRDARSFVEATYATRDVGAPLAVYAAGDVSLGARSEVRDGSVFAGGNVRAESGASVSGRDLVYDRWLTERNAVARADSSAAVAAVGDVSGFSGPFYSQTTTPVFSAEPSAGSLTFPFDPFFWRDEDHLAFMEEVAREQGNLIPRGDLAWPEDAPENTVVFAGGGPSAATVVDAESCPAAEPCRGTLVVAEGNARVGSGTDFSGVIVVAKGGLIVEEGATVRGAVVAGGDLDLRGRVEASGPDLRLRPGHFGLSVYGWREPVAPPG